MSTSMPLRQVMVMLGVPERRRLPRAIGSGRSGQRSITRGGTGLFLIRARDTRARSSHHDAARGVLRGRSLKSARSVSSVSFFHSVHFLPPRHHQHWTRGSEEPRDDGIPWILAR